MSQEANINVSVCIPTRNRPEELRECLLSLEQSTVPINQIIVSDDSTDSQTHQQVLSEFPNVDYLIGPRKGVGANRNNAVRAVDSDYVLFLDDDGQLGSSFLESVHSCLRRSRDPQRTIVTGLTLNTNKDNYLLLYPTEQDFLGFMSVEYKRGRACANIVLNSVVFPRVLFDELEFDESLIYGYEEVDLATRARAKRYSILVCESAVNSHYQSTVPTPYKQFTEASRVYVTYKRYTFTEKNPIKGLAYLLVATIHLFVSTVKRRGFVGVLEAVRTIKTSYSYIQKLY